MTCFCPPISVPAAPWRLAVLLVGLLLLSRPVAAQDPSPVQSLIDQGATAGANTTLMRTVASRAEQAGLSPQATADLLQPAVTLAERNLPATPLLNKTLEGLAKRVPPNRMTPVLQNVQSHLEQGGTLVSAWLDRGEVQSLLGGSSPPTSERNQLIANVAEARQQEIPISTVESFLNELPTTVERRSVPLSAISVAVSVMPDLPEIQNNPSASSELLTAALSAGYDAESMRQLPSALERARQTSQRPAATIARGTAQAISKGTPAATVLRNLFQGAIPGGGPPSSVGNTPSGPPGQGKPPGNENVPPGVDPGRPGSGENPGQGSGGNSGQGPGGNPGSNGR